MTVPTPTLFSQGLAAVGADAINTFVQACSSVAQARGFIGTGQMMIYLEGYSAPGDGGQGPFVWNSTSTATDDGGLTVIAPTAATTQGRWIRLAGTVLVNRAIVYVIDGGGSAISTGIAGALYLPFGVTLTSASLLADQSGSVVVDIWATPFASYPPSSGNTITGSSLPTLSSAIDYLDTTLTGWTKTLAAGTTLIFNVNSASTVTRLTITLGAIG